MAYFNQMSQSQTQSSHVFGGAGFTAFGSMSQFGGTNFVPVNPVLNFGTQMTMSQSSNMTTQNSCSGHNTGFNFGGPVAPVLCRCNIEARRLTVKKNNNNCGRGFYNCRKTIAEGRCSFFAWADEVEPGTTWVPEDITAPPKVRKTTAKPKAIKSVKGKKVVNGVIKSTKKNSMDIEGEITASPKVRKTTAKPKAIKSVEGKKIVNGVIKGTKKKSMDIEGKKINPENKTGKVTSKTNSSPSVILKKTKATKVTKKNPTQPKKSPVKKNNVVQKENKLSPSTENKLQIANKIIKLEEKKLRLEKKKLQLEERKLKLASQN